MSEQDQDNPRRDFLRKTLTLIPVVTVASTGLGSAPWPRLKRAGHARAKPLAPTRAITSRAFSLPKNGLSSRQGRALIPADDLARVHWRPERRNISIGR